MVGYWYALARNVTQCHAYFAHRDLFVTFRDMPFSDLGMEEVAGWPPFICILTPRVLCVKNWHPLRENGMSRNVTNKSRCAKYA